MNRHKETFKTITNSSCKIKLQQNQKKITKTNIDQIKPEKNKPKLKAKQPVKTMKQRKSLSKK